MTFQPKLNLSGDTGEYNGWYDWTTWNCALWIGGDEGLYNEARFSRSYGEFVQTMQAMGMNKTPDGADWDVANYDEMQEMMDELAGELADD